MGEGKLQLELDRSVIVWKISLWGGGRGGSSNCNGRGRKGRHWGLLLLLQDSLALPPRVLGIPSDPGCLPACSAASQRVGGPGSARMFFPWCQSEAAVGCHSIPRPASTLPPPPKRAQLPCGCIQSSWIASNAEDGALTAYASGQRAPPAAHGGILHWPRRVNQGARALHALGPASCLPERGGGCGGLSSFELCSGDGSWPQVLLYGCTLLVPWLAHDYSAP